MIKLQTSGFFASAHFLDKYEGQCKNIHGHTYAYYVEVESEALQNDMVVDFSCLKGLDHSLMINVNSEYYKQFKEFFNNFKVILFDSNPTAEQIAKRVEEILLKENPKIDYCKVRIWEDIKSLVNQDDLRIGVGEFIERIKCT